MGRLSSSLAPALFSTVAISAIVTGQARFESRVDMVAVDVCATDHHGRPVPVELSDLAVFDNGAHQQIVMFSPGDHVPLAITLLVDSSQSMHGGLLDRATVAATALIEQLPADALVEVMSFNDHVTVPYPMGADHSQAERSLAEPSPSGATALYEAARRDSRSAARRT